MMRKLKRTIIQIMAIMLILVVMLVGVSIYTFHNGTADNPIIEYIFTKKVEQYREIVTEYAGQYEIEQHVNVLLAMMMQESGGRGDDPMQSSESLCGEIGCIDDPEQSVQQGVAYFAKILDYADGDISLAVQAYNFGIGFVGYVKDNEQEFNQEIAIEFSRKMYQQADDKSIYSCLRKGSEELEACYGDIYYARDVMAYKDKFSREK